MTQHARIRARERYSLAIYQDDFDGIAEQITDGRAEKLKKITKNQSVYRVNVQNKVCIVVYDRLTKAVITFLPTEWRKHLVEQEAKLAIAKTYYRKGRLCRRGESE